MFARTTIGISVMTRIIGARTWARRGILVSTMLTVGAIVVRDGGVYTAFAWKLYYDDACERLSGISGSREGGKFGADLNGRGDDVGAGGVGVDSWPSDRLDRIIGIWVIGFSSHCGSIATGVERLSFAVAHSSEGGEFWGSKVRRVKFEMDAN
jgi:hypothetical protein